MPLEDLDILHSDLQDEEAIWKDLQRQLDAGKLATGKLPGRFSELKRLVDPESGEGREFQTYMEELTHKLLPTWDFKAHPINFYISDTPDVNAGVIAGHEPALMFFNKGLLKLVGDNENELLHVLGHELGHELFREALGDIKISKPEEILVNMPSIQWMYENGIDPRPAVDFAKKLADDDYEVKRQNAGELKGDKVGNLMDVAIAVMDEHLNPAFDVDTLNNAMVAYRSQVAGDFSDRKLLKIPERMQELFKTAAYDSPVSKASREIKFETLKWQDQLAFIRDQSKDAGQGHVAGRGKDLLALLEQVDNDVNPTSKTLGAEIVAALIDKPSAYKRLYGTIAGNLFDQKADVPLPPLTDLIPLMRSVVEAKTSDEYMAACTALVKRAGDFKACPLEKLKWPPSYKIPGNIGKSGVSLPWEQQVNWAIDALGKGEQDPAKALVMLGAEDPRLYEAMPDKLLKQVLNGRSDINSLTSSSSPAEQHITNSARKVGNPLYALAKPSGSLGGLELDASGGALKIRHAESAQSRWRATGFLVDVLERREAAVLNAEPHVTDSRFKFTGALPYRDGQEFERWFSEHRAMLSAPAILGEPGPTAERFQGQMVSWFNESEKSRSAILDAYHKAAANGRLGGNARYDAQFLHVLSRQVLPFEEQAGQVTQMLEAQLAQGGDNAKQLVREFFLNPADKPGLRQLLENGKKPALLSPDNAYVAFLSRHPDLFTVEEKASVMSQHVALPENPQWWQQMLATRPVTDMESLTEFVTTAQKFSDHLRLFEKGHAPRLQGNLDSEDTREAFFVDVAKTYFTAILGYNYAGQFDLSALLEHPPEMMSRLCSTRKEELEEHPLIDIERFMRGLVTKESQNTFGKWYVAHATVKEMEHKIDVDTDETERRMSLEEKRKAFVNYLKAPGSLAEEFIQNYMDLDGRPEVTKPFPSIPVEGSDYIRDILRKHIAAQGKWPDAHERRAAIYKHMDGLDLFPNAQWQAAFRDKLLEDISRETDADKKLQSIEIILAGEPVKDPAVRQQASKIWASALAEKMVAGGFGKGGRDDGSEPYLQALMPSIEWAEKNVPTAERYRLFTELADTVESQRTLSYRLRDSFKLSGEEIERSDGYFRGVEAVLLYATHQDGGRQSMLDYLMQENTDDSRKKFGAWLQKHRQLMKAVDDLELYNYQFVNAINLTSDPDYYMMQAQNIYNNFWQAPLPARIAVMDQLLMTPDEKGYGIGKGNDKESVAKRKESEAAYNRAYNYVVDHLLPADLPHARESRVALETYKDILPANERALFLSALLSANDATRQAGDSMSTGERLAVVLEMMGPATIKFGQALSNYPDAPLDLREPMVRLTKHAAPSTRWNLWSRYDEVVPEEYRDGVKRMGKVLGTGSYQESVRLEKNDGTHSVMKLQRPHVERLADAGFKQLRDFVQELKKKETSVSADMAEAADNCVHQAQTMAAKETDAVYRLAQVKQAQGYYNPISITVDGINFRFKTANWLAYGVDREEIPHRTDRKEWCDEREMPGVHFDELPGNTPQERAYKKAVAKATVASELAVLLSGRPIDNDRHPAQLRVDSSTNQIGLFDHGALDLEPPTRNEKQLLAKALVNITQSYQQGDSLPELFYQQLKEIKAEQGSVPDYLVRVERGVLAMSKFFGQMSNEDLKDALAAVHKAGLIDKEILDTTIKVKLPVVGMQSIKLSAALNRALPTKPSMTLSMHPVDVEPEPVRYDYSHKSQTSHPQFPGVRAGTAPKSGRNDTGPGDDDGTAAATRHRGALASRVVKSGSDSKSAWLQ